MNQVPASGKANTALHASIAAAFTGSRAGIQAFYEHFLTGPLFVIDRQQTQNLSDQPVYPSQLTSILGVKDQARNVIPCFSDPLLIENWCGMKLNYSEVTGSNLLKRVPENWWVIVNPGEEIEKELSPWELKLLISGKDAIPELIEELAPEQSIDPIKLIPIEESHNPKLFQVLQEFGENNTAIVSIVAAKEEGVDQTGEVSNLIIIGVNFDDKNQNTKELLNNLHNQVAPTLIGDLAFKIYSNADDASEIKLGMLRQFEAWYTRTSKKNLFQKILNIFT